MSMSQRPSTEQGGWASALAKIARSVLAMPACLPA